MKILILGNNGFLGRQITSYFHNKKYNKYNISTESESNFEIIGIDRTNNNSVQSCNFGNFYDYNILDLKCHDKILEVLLEKKPDIIINLMAQMFPTNGNELYYTNPKIALNICSILKKYLSCSNEKLSFLHVGSAAEYGTKDSEQSITEKDDTTPTSAYGETKLLQTLIFNEFAKSISNCNHLQQKISIKIARVFNIVNKDMTEDFFFPLIVGKFLSLNNQSNQPEITVRSLYQTRDYLHTTDVIPALEAIIFKGKHGEIYNVSSSIGITAKNAIDYLQKKFHLHRLDIIDESSGVINFSIGNNQKLKEIYDLKITKNYIDILDELIEAKKEKREKEIETIL
ncbi:MAG: NAD-dependent epimerase/dehydratase family protein [Oligoflexia bacterium]|nr:NAD-dependent epimerase/dehydratase family protein [Oligoflexia bacterium]